MTFSIFRVYDYKGGELSSVTNLSKERFIEHLSELFENIDYNNIQLKRDRNINDILEVNTESIIDEISKNLEKIITQEDFYSTYAGGEGFVGEIYKVENDKMTKVNIESFIPDIAKYIYETW